MCQSVSAGSYGLGADPAAWSTINDVFAWIEDSLAEGAVVLVALIGGMNHYSVIIKTTARSLRLFDSTGMKSVRKSSCSLRGSYHELPPNGLLRIVVQPSG